jgi:3-dehydroquinate synthase
VPGSPDSPDGITLHGSRICVGAGLLDACGVTLRATVGDRRLAIISDDIVAPLYAARLAAAVGGPAPRVFVIPAGEASKTRMQWARLTDELLAAGFGRDTAILALGGGVVGDLAGFVAATFMRGVPVVQVPTTLLAMIDASIGGKTGVDTRAGKNLVGAFHHPALVIIDPSALRTLPAAHWRSGVAEAIKHGVVASPAEFGWLADHAGSIVNAEGRDDATVMHLVREQVRLKASIVARDERESGLRKVLNFGHTIGHAIETLSDFGRFHGECVAIGMMVEARIAALAGLADAALPESIARVLLAAGLPTTPPPSMSSAAILEATRTDKKARGGVVEYALPRAIGAMAGADRGYAIAVADGIVAAALEAAR